MSRKTIGVLILILWVGALAFLYNRTTHQTLDQRLTEVGMRVSPETFYYSLMQGDAQVGAASSSVDTSKTKVIAADMVRGRFPTGKDTLRIEARSEARFTRGMRLSDFVLRASGDLTPFQIRGVMQEGEAKTLRITTEQQGERAITQEAIADAPVFLPTVAPLPLLLTRAPEIGDSVNVSLFDPMSRSLKNVTLHIEADSLFLIADSATFDSTSNKWVKARQDSVRGWRITRTGAPLTAWVDRAGRLIAASEPGGITMIRTAFEIAFRNFQAEEAGRTGAANKPGGAANNDKRAGSQRKP
ncbi:MAG TPA: hypothetical protein VJL35_07425 [Gemmatimonadaceae bacterium]|nr:hypothetical protein [Gemmatimonadaceae bacterium]